MTESFFEHVAADPRRRTRWALAMIGVGLGGLLLFHNRIYNSLAGLIGKHLPGRRVTLEDIAFLEEIYSKLVEGPAAAAAALTDPAPRA